MKQTFTAYYTLLATKTEFTVKLFALRLLHYDSLIFPITEGSEFCLSISFVKSSLGRHSVPLSLDLLCLNLHDLSKAAF